MPAVWDGIKDSIELAIDESDGRATMEIAHQRIMDGYDQVWILSDKDRFLASVVTSVEQYPGKKMLRVSWGGGNEVVKNIGIIGDSLYFWAQHNGCDGMECPGRRGWEKVFKKIGARVCYQMYEIMFDEKHGGIYSTE